MNIPLRLHIVTAFAVYALACMVGCEPGPTAPPPTPSVASPRPDPAPPPAPAPDAPSWFQALAQFGGTAEFARTYDGGTADSTRTATGIGPAFSGSGEHVDVSKFDGSAPAANAGADPAATGGAVIAGFKTWTDSGGKWVLTLLALAGLLALAYSAWLIKSRAAVKDSAIAGAAGIGLLAAAVFPALLLWVLAGVALVLLVRFGPLAMQARAYEPARAVIGGIGVLEEQAAKMSDALGSEPVNFRNQREFVLAAINLVKDEIRKQQTGSDREITRDMRRADNLP